MSSPLGVWSNTRCFGATHFSQAGLFHTNNVLFYSLFEERSTQKAYGGPSTAGDAITSKEKIKDNSIKASPLPALSPAFYSTSATEHTLTCPA